VRHKKLSDPELAELVYARHQQMVSNMSPWLPWWQEIADYVMPRGRNLSAMAYGGGYGPMVVPTTSMDANLFDSTAAQSNMILANGQMSLMTPVQARWFAYDPPHFLKGVDNVERYYKQCSERIALELARSNFYTAIHELYLDRGGFGTAILWLELGRKSLFNFTKFDVGSFAISDDDEGYADTLTRTMNMSTRQIVQWFGYQNCSDTVKNSYDRENGRGLEDRYEIVSQCFNRDVDQINPKSLDSLDMPIGSVYMEGKSKKILRTSGYDELPFFVTRYARWLHSTPYGWCPSALALPDARQLNFLERQMDALAEVSAFPRILAPDTHKQEFDLRACGVTYYDSSNPAAVPREWATQGKYDVGKDRSEQRRKIIREAYHVDLFRMFSEIEKQMTAREVAERSAEKINQFSATFTRLTTELFTPMLQRIFRLSYRAGILPPVPRELIIPQRGGGASMPPPEVSYSSRIALAIKSLENSSFYQVGEMWMPYFQYRPDLMDNLSFDNAFRDSVRNSGLPDRWLPSRKPATPCVSSAPSGKPTEMQAELMGVPRTRSVAPAMTRSSAVLSVTRRRRRSERIP
jgi:hypothetical protein